MDAHRGSRPSEDPENFTFDSDLTVSYNFKAPEQEDFERRPLSLDARVLRRDRLGGLLHE